MTLLEETHTELSSASLVVIKIKVKKNKKKEITSWLGNRNVFSARLEINFVLGTDPKRLFS